MAVEMQRSVQYIVGPNGEPTAAVVEIGAWKWLLGRLEDLEAQDDLAEARAALRELEAAGGDAERAAWPSLENIGSEPDE